jgi:hypothetical protein
MGSIRRIILFWLALSCSSHALADAKDEILAEQIARLPWNAEVNVGADASDAQIEIRAHYLKPNVVEDKETRYISVYQLKTTMDKQGRIITKNESTTASDICRDGAESWCNGSGRLENANKQGFDYHLKLTWQKGNNPVTRFDEVFHCHWVKEQKFNRDGLSLTIQVNLPNK